jgi:error-prone DNA polymerase
VLSGCAKKEWSELTERRTLRPFETFEEVILRSGLRRTVLRSLALSGAFEEFGLQTRDAFWRLLALESYRRDAEATQLSLFLGASAGALNESGVVGFHSASELQKIWNDYEATGLSLRGHPMQEARKRMRGIPKHTSRTIRKLSNGTHASIAGLSIIMQRPPTAKGTVFATLEDEEGLLDLILWGNVFERYKDLLRAEGMVIVSGEIQRDSDAVSLLVRSLRSVPCLFEENSPLETIRTTRKMSEGVLNA